MQGLFRKKRMFLSCFIDFHGCIGLLFISIVVYGPYWELSSSFSVADDNVTFAFLLMGVSFIEFC